jgi:foldase protein PrsA
MYYIYTKEITMKKIIPLILASCLALSMAACNGQPKMGVGDKVLATSGDEKIMLRDFLYTLGMTKSYNEYFMMQSFGMTEEDMAEYWNTETEDGQTLADDLKDYTLESMKEVATFAKLAKDEGLKYSDSDIKELKETLDNAVLSLASKEKTGERAFYEKYFVTVDEAMEAEKVISAANQYKNKIKDAIEVSDDEITAYYDENKETFEEVTVAHILVKFPENALDADKAETKAKAEGILERVKTGEDFGTLAAELSEDDGSKDNNGEYTVTRSTNFVPEFLDWAFSSSDGDLGIIETTYGYHVMKFVKATPFEDLKEKVKSSIVDTKFQEEIEKVASENKLEWTVDEEMLKSVVVQPATEAPAASEEPASESPTASEQPTSESPAASEQPSETAKP